MRQADLFRRAPHGATGRAVYGLPSLSFACALIIATASAPVPAQTVYKWTDDKGVVNYTTTPPDKRKAKTIDAAPAVAGKSFVTDYDEARYWRDRNLRESVRDLRDERLRGETEALRQNQLRSEAATRSAGTRQKSMQELMVAQCKSERRVDCDTGPYGAPGFASYGYTGYPYYPAVVVVSQTPAATAAAPYFSTTPNFTPGFSRPLVYSNPR